MKNVLLAAGLAASLGAAPASAAIYITTAEVGPDLVFNFTGSLDLTGMTRYIGGTLATVYNADLGAILFNGAYGGMSLYEIDPLPSFGPDVDVPGTATGDQFKIFSNNVVAFASGYGGEVISGSLTVPGSAVSLGLIDGVYETYALSGDFIRLTIGATAVPLPAAAPLLLGALGLLGLARRKRG